MSGETVTEIDGFTRAEIGVEEVMRANTYGLLAQLLRTIPTQGTLDSLRKLQRAPTELGTALGELADAAASSSQDEIDDEFHDLFIGVGGADLKPYASYYLTGFMYEKPLAKLRAAMAELGIEKDDDVAEPEDHIASLCEMMCGLIIGAFGAPADLEAQHRFFDEQVAPWAEKFFEDLEAAPAARFYKPVGTVGKLFMRIESQAFEMAA